MNKPQALRRNHSWPLLVALAAPAPLACVAPAGTDATDGAGGKAPAGGDNSLAGSSGDGGSQSHPSGGQNGSGGKASGGASPGGGSVGGAHVGGSNSGGANQAGAGGDDGSGGASCTGDCPFAVTQISAGYEHNCALSALGQVTCWGENSFGQIGLETISAGEVPPTRVDLGETQRAVSVTAAGRGHSCATFEDGSVKCWGLGRSGALGSGSTENVGDEANEMGSSLEPVALGTGAQVRSLVGGYEHTCALLVGGGVKCWGDNSYGQLGLGDVTSRGDNSGEMGDELSFVDLGVGVPVRALAAGAYHTCAIFDDGSVKCWGLGHNGQLGLGASVNQGDAPYEMGDSLSTIDLGSGRSAKAISAGRAHTCAILDDDSVKCWGLGQYGTLGQGDELSRGDEPGEMGDALPTVQLGTGQTLLSISTGGAHTCGLFNQGAVKCWGNNWHAQLGTADGDSLGDEPGEMGDNLPAVSLW